MMTDSQWHKRWFAMGLLFGSLLYPGGLQARSILVDRLVAVVENKPLLLSQFRGRMKPLLQKFKTNNQDAALRKKRRQRLRRNLLQKMIDEIIIMQKAKGYGLVVRKAEIDRMMHSVARRNQLTPKQLHQELQRSGWSIRLYRTQLAIEFLKLRLFRRVVGGRHLLPKGLSPREKRIQLFHLRKKRSNLMVFPLSKIHRREKTVDITFEVSGS